MDDIESVTNRRNIKTRKLVVVPEMQVKTSWLWFWFYMWLAERVTHNFLTNHRLQYSKANTITYHLWDSTQIPLLWSLLGRWYTLYSVPCLVPHWVTCHLMSYYKYQEAFLWFVPSLLMDTLSLDLQWNEKKSIIESNPWKGSIEQSILINPINIIIYQ